MTFEQAEIEERNKAIMYFVQKTNTHINKIAPVGSYLSWDMSIFSATTQYINISQDNIKVIVEVKDRNCTSTRYNTSVMSEDKYNKLLNLLQYYRQLYPDTIFTGILLNFYTDGVAVENNIETDFVKVSSKQAPAKTAVEEKHIITKSFAEFRIPKQ